MALGCLLALLVLNASIRLTNAQVFYEFGFGTNASIEFDFTIKEEAIYQYDTFIPDKNCVFCLGGDIITACLMGDQKERFIVLMERNRTNLIVTLFINNVNSLDSGFYVLSLEENHIGKERNTIQVAFLEVILPPGRAECWINYNSYSRTWKEVRYNATAASNGGGINMPSKFDKMFPRSTK